MMKKSLICLLGLIFWYLPASVFAQCDCDFVIKSTEWTVDGKAMGVKPGDKVCFQNGTRKNLQIHNMVGTAANPIIITNMCDGKVLVDGTASTTTPYGIEVYGSSYFKVTGTGNSSEPYGIQITHTHMGIDLRGFSTNFEVDHMKVYDITSVAFVGKTDPTCDPKTWKGAFTMRDVKFHDNYVSNSADEGFYVGNSHYSSGVSKTCNGSTITVYEHEVIGVDIYNNTVLNPGRDGIQVGSTTSQCNIHDNYVENFATRALYGHQSGIQINQGTVANIYRNKLIKGTGFGIFVSGSGGSRVVDNLVTDAAQGGIFANDFAPFYNNVSYVFLNNTLINNRDYGIYMLSEKTVNNMFANNIIVAPNQSGFQYVKLNSSKISWTEKNNIKTTDINSVKFVNVSGKDYHLQSSSTAVNEGFNLTSYGVTDDLDKVARPSGGAFDIGAYEYKSSGSSAAPVANAGADKSIKLPTSSTTLTGSGTDSDGTIASYAWTKKSGGAATLANAGTATLSVSGLVAGTYVFTLKVTDNSGLTGSDDVTLTVNAAGTSNPVANAGADKTITLPTNTVSFTGSGTDSDGTISSYTWTKKSGGAVTMVNAGTATVTINGTGLVAGTYVFTLKVTDNAGLTATDDVTLTVKAASGGAPVADAGTDKTITLPINTVSFRGSGTDTGGSIASYQWTKKSGGAVTMVNAGTATVTINGIGLAAGTYVFTLKVTDNTGLTATDDVTLTVNAASGGTPVANAGPDKTLTLPTNWTTFSGSGTDNDGSIASYQWTKKSGGTVMLAYPTTAKLGVSGLVAGTYVFTLKVTDNSGLTATDDVTLVVKAAGGSAAPTANAGADKTVTLPTTTAALTGSGTDPDGSIASYAWSEKSGGPVTMTNANTSTVSLSGLAAGTYVFTLKATDNSGLSATDDVTLVVKASSSSGAAPVANAGPDKTTTLPINWTTFSGSGTDSDGTIASYQWTKKSGGTVMLAYPATAKLGVSGLVAGTYVFTLKVTDNSGATATDDVKLVVLAAGTAAAPPEARMASDSVTEDVDSGFEEESATSEEEFVFLDKHYAGGFEYAVIVFNDSGKKLFQGKWTPENYNEVFQGRGFYLYQIFQNGIKIDSGKTFITR